MLHRAVLGSFERFIGILIEEYEGAFPTWLAPTQVAILNITDNQRDYCQKLAEKWDSLGYRVNADLRNEKIGFKIREHTLNKVPSKRLNSCWLTTFNARAEPRRRTDY